MNYIDEMIASRREAINEVQLTPELVSEFKDAMLEMTMNVLYNNSDETYIMVSEGANIEATKAFKNRMKEIIKYINNCGSITNKGDLKAAQDELKKAIESVNAFETDIKRIDFTTGSAVFGFFASYFISKIQMLLPNLIVKLMNNSYNKTVANNFSDYIGGVSSSFINNTENLFVDNKEPNFVDLLKFAVKFNDSLAKGGNGNPEISKAYKKLKIAIVFRNIINFVKNIRVIYSVFKRYKAGDNSDEALNLYRNKMLMVCSDLKKILSAMISSYDKSIAKTEEKSDK